MWVDWVSVGGWGIILGGWDNILSGWGWVHCLIMPLSVSKIYLIFLMIPADFANDQKVICNPRVI